MEFIRLNRNIISLRWDIAHQYNMYSVAGKEQRFCALLQKCPMSDWNGRTDLA